MTERQITIMQDFKSDVLFCTPSYALTIAERAEEMKVDIKKLPLRVGVFGAEPWTEGMRQEIEERMGIKAQEAYGLTELCGPGVAYDAADQNGLYINEDFFLAEVVDPQTLEPLPEGEKGELIFTSLQRRAMPMIRYRTKDITRLWREPGSTGLIKLFEHVRGARQQGPLQTNRPPPLLKLLLSRLSIEDPLQAGGRQHRQCRSGDNERGQNDEQRKPGPPRVCGFGLLSSSKTEL
jgi:phenylacetate-coenzyme A ligase PaaK-like adenylate-forming protein